MLFFFLNTLRTLEAELGITSEDRGADCTHTHTHTHTHFSDARAQANFHRAPRLKTTARERNPRVIKGPTRRRMGFKADGFRSTCATRARPTRSLNYELPNFAAIPDQEEESEEPAPGEPAPATLDPSDLFAYSSELRQSAHAKPSS